MSSEEVMRLSWTNELYKIYENNCGKEDEKSVLLPVAHSTANAQIEVTLSEEGKFISATRIESKEDSVTIIPVTEDSGARSSGIAPHPLADKLVYTAGDYGQYATGKRSDNKKYYEAYIEQLEKWVNSEYSIRAVEIIHKYLKEATLMEDLVSSKCLIFDGATGKLKEKEKIIGIAQEDAFVRFRINYQDMVNTESRTWKDKKLYDSFADFYMSNSSDSQLCYATGKNLPCTYKHPSKIRNAGDKAKLISSNDESGFTYRGRFNSKEQALSVSYDFSQKLHNALKWLIDKQGISIGPMTVVVWESNLQPLPEIIGNFEDDEFDFFDEEETNVIDTLAAYRNQLKKVIWGKEDTVEVKSMAMVMILDAATTGRLSMTMYSELPVSDFLCNIEKWHKDTAWNRFIMKKKKREIRSFSLYEIADTAFGTEQGKEIKCKAEIRNDVILRLIPCVVERRNVPKDVIRNLINKASRPMSYSNSYNWRKVLEVTCGMLRKSIIERKENRNMKGEYEVALDKNCEERSYLYGRLLAVADAAEASTYEKGEERTTNAKRYFEMFSNKPCQTWGVVYNRLQPYFNRMKTGQRVYYEKLIGEIMEQFEIRDYKNNGKLEPEYLLAYHCQLNEIYTKKDTSKEEK